MDLTFTQVALPYDVDSLVALIPELQEIPAETLSTKIAADLEPILLVAYAGNEIAGFKLGYALSPEIFYSWIGGVVPGHRGRGIARSLLHLQEKIITARGYRSVRVKSMNCFPAMLYMLISENYRVTGIELSGIPMDEPKILFEKGLVENQIVSFPVRNAASA